MGFDPFFLGALNKQCTEKTGPSCQKGSVSEWQKPQNFFGTPLWCKDPEIMQFYWLCWEIMQFYWLCWAPKIMSSGLDSPTQC